MNIFSLFNFRRAPAPANAPEVLTTENTERTEKKKKPVGAPSSSTAPKRASSVSAQQFDPRSESNLATLHPEAAKRARVFLAAANSLAEQRGFTVRIISGLRTYDEQDALYAQGRTTPGAKVTNARAGFSNHNFGLAWDIGIFSGKKYLEEDTFYTELGQLGESLGLEWGGRWKFRDEPHYQLRPAWATAMTEREMLATLRSRVSQKKDLFA